MSLLLRFYEPKTGTVCLDGGSGRIEVRRLFDLAMAVSNTPQRHRLYTHALARFKMTLTT